MHPLIRNRWPLILAMVVFLGTIAFVLAAELRQTEGHLIYALDDAYIHMAMAKNIAHHGVYGVTEHEFSSSSSSPLWTLLLALANSVFGVHEVLPLAMNLILGLSILIAVHAMMRRMMINPTIIAAALLLVVVATPMPAMVFSGMEHLLHILLTMLFLWLFAHLVAAERGPSQTPRLTLLVTLAAALVLVRYESYALLVIAGLFFMLRRRWMAAGGLGLAGILPMLSFQAISVAHGWSWLPNSVLVRTGLSTPGTGADSGSSAAVSSGISLLDGMLTTFLNNVATGLPLAALIVVSGTALLISLHRKSSIWSPNTIMASVFILAALTHMTFGHTGHLFRYEAYLVAIGLFASACIIPEATAAPVTGLIGNRGKRTVMTVLALSSVPALFLLTSRSITSLEQTPIAGRNIYEQQYQMGVFLQRYYPDETVVLNDIGAVSFLTRVRLLDLVGLANIDVLRLKRAGEYDAGHIQALCRQYGAGIAIVYDSWLRRVDSRGGPLPWTKVGEWRIPGNVICSDDIVSLYAVQDSERETLVRNLRSHSSLLPANVIQTGPYTEKSFPGHR